MNRYEKIAWYNVAVFGAALACFTILFLIIHAARPDFTIIRQLQFAFASVGICGLWGLSPILFRKKSTEAITEDERDIAIARRSKFIGHLIFWLCFCMINMGVWGVYHSMGIGKISVDFLPIMVFTGMIVVMMSQSIALLVLYRTNIIADPEGK